MEATVQSGLDDMSGKWKFWIIGLGIILSMVYLVVSSIQATGVRYLQVNELPHEDLSAYNQTVKVTGKVVGGTLQYDPHAPRVNFRMEGPEGQTVQVRYDGLKPDAMQEGGHVIVTGPYDRETHRIKARTLLAKCPSRYETRYKDADTSKR